MVSTVQIEARKICPEATVQVSLISDRQVHRTESHKYGDEREQISQQQTNEFSRQTDSADRFRKQTDGASDSDIATDQTADSHAYADKPGQNQTNAQPDVTN
ncbi:hypothetical protein Tco_1441208, partial [Tanacetum coccineum]